MLISFAVNATSADLRLCFRICNKPVFSRRGSYLFIIPKHASYQFLWSVVNTDDFSGHFFRIFVIIIFCFVVAICDIGARWGGYVLPSVSVNSIWKYFLKYE